MKPTINRPGKPAAGRTPGRPPAPGGSASAQRTIRERRATAFASGVVNELRRVTWPTREEWVTATLLTIALVLVVGVYTAAADHLFGWLIGLITGNATR